MKELDIIGNVRERDIDLLVLEELHVSPKFLRHFMDCCGFSEVSHLDFVGAWHSVSRAGFGQSDLIALVADVDANEHAVMIEDKITAAPQPGQAERYRKRGEDGIEEGEWITFRTCMIAPERYLTAQPTAKDYDHRISYETLRRWILDLVSPPERAEYKARLIDLALDESRRGYEVVPNEAVTTFHHKYYEILVKDYSELKMKPPTVAGAKSGWMKFYPSGLKKGFRLRHKTRHGRVDLELLGCGDHVGQIKEENASFLQSDMKVAVRGQSAAISIDTPKVEPFDPLENQEAEVRKGLNAAIRLWHLSKDVVWPE